MKVGISASQRWPLLVIGALAAQMGFGFWMMHVAGSDPNFAIEPDYYARAVNWDSTMAQSRRDHALGWRAVATLARAAGDAAVLAIAVVDSSGAPVMLDSLHADILPIAHADRVRSLSLARANERWEIPVPHAPNGLWETNIRAVHGTDVFTARLRPELK
jgi:nitrogen fixation protein FixH